MNIYEQILKNIETKDKKSDETENKKVNDHIEYKGIHDKQITLFGSEKYNKYDNEEIFTDDTEVVKMGKKSAQINKYNIHTGADKRDQASDEI